MTISRRKFFSLTAAATPATSALAYMSDGEPIEPFRSLMVRMPSYCEGSGMSGEIIDAEKARGALRLSRETKQPVGYHTHTNDRIVLWVRDDSFKDILMWKNRRYMKEVML